jgi:hypothetical protein
MIDLRFLGDWIVSFGATTNPTHDRNGGAHFARQD